MKFKSGSLPQTAVRWLCLVSSLLLLVVGVIHICNSSAELNWPKGKFTDDINAATWRFALFSFKPSVFIDSWTCIVLALIGIAGHLKDCNALVSMSTKDMLSAGLFQLICGLFGTIAYAGGIGMIFSAVTFLASLGGLVMAFVEDDTVSLEIEIGRK